jgi:MFS family permease
MGTRLASGAVSLNPNSSNLPGSTVLQKLVDGIGGWALLLALVGLIIGAATWAIGAHSQNYQQSYNGRRAVLVSALAALIIGAAPAVINFLFGSGTQIHSPLG